MPHSTRKSEGTLTSFTVDAEVSGVHEMPGITKLLNRKKLETSTTYTKATPPPFPASPTPGSTVSIQLESMTPPPPSAPVDGIALTLEPAEVPLSEPTVAISLPNTHQNAQPRPAAKRSSSPTMTLKQWNLSTLASTVGKDDTLGQLVLALRELGATDLLFFIPETGTAQTSSHFFSSAVLSSSATRISLWQGVCWKMENFPDLWKELQTTGRSEFPAAPTVTQIRSTRNLLRTSLGLGSNASQVLTLLRVGSTQKTRGVLAVISPTGLPTLPDSLVQLQNAES